MKKATKLKTVQPPKGNLKISNFFHKKVTSHVNSSINAHAAQSAHVSGANDCDIVQFNDTCGNCNEGNDITPGCVCKTIDCTIVQDTSYNLIYSDDSTQDNNKKRKFSSPDSRNSLLSKRRNSLCENASSSSDNTYKAVIRVKTPDKLFPQTRIEYHLSRTDVNANQHVKSPLKNCDTNIGIPQSRKTPSKTPKKSPKLKLFDKSPEKLEEFNVQIINNFIKITPSKSSNKVVNDIKLSESDSKRQTSMLQYVSPGSSGAKKAQEFNETTPKKENHNKTVMVSPSTSRAKLKLDFSSCVNIGKDEEANLCNDLMFANLGNEFQDDWDITFNATSEDLKLDLQQPKHCKVLESVEKRNRITIKVKSTSNNEKAICYLEGFWISLRLKPDDIVYLKAAKDVEGNWIINNEDGLLVYEPDLLISSTSIAQSVFCMRRKVLSEKYPGFEPTNRIMVIGVFVHQLLQIVLKRNIRTTSGIAEIVEELVSSNHAIRRMYEASLSLSDVRNELSQFIPKIMDFVQCYVLDVSPQFKKSMKNAQIQPWNGKIDSVDDIEENIWCPQLGVKGKVDVSVRSKDKVYPLELKTGRASMSLEHRGQVILYVMMMNSLGHDISSGLLHYLKEGLLTEINITHKESRDIMILRNELAYFLSKTPNISNDENLKCDTTEPHVFELPELPAPIDLSHACKHCDYNVICSSYVPYENHDNSCRQNFLKIQKDSISHLHKPHLDYFIWWSLLLSLENMAHKDGKSVREIYTEPPSKRAEKGRCINNVRILKVEEKTDCIFEHTFERDGGVGFVNFLASGIEENSYVVVSTDDRPAVSSGFVISISVTSVTINLERNLTRKFGNYLFHLDTYDSACSTGFNMACLALLIENSPSAERLRKIIIDKEAPKFASKLPKIVAVKALPILKRLNKSQQKAVLKSLAAEDYLLIKGMPGTGKTATIVALVQLLVEVNKTVLITSHTHSAIDNVCVRLQKFGIDVLRLGSISRINEQVKLNSEYTQTKHCKTPEEIEAVYNKAPVVAVTCLGSGHPLLSKRTVDVCLVDESTQVIQPSIFRSLSCAKTFILIGDPEQLEPTVKNREAIKKGMTETLFERLQSPDACIVLDQNYRMNKTITALANLLTYNGELLIGNETVANAHLHIPNEESLRNMYKDQHWILNVLDTSLECAVQFVDTNLESVDTNFDEKNDKSYVNMYEAAIVTKLVAVLLESGVSRHDIGVIATYRDQVAYISRQLVDVDVSTVDQFQGRDKKVILYSCTKYKIQPDGSISQFHLLENHKRLTVAVTRAKHKLIIIGEMNVIKQHKPFAKMLNALDKSRLIKLENEKYGFNWNALLKLNSRGKIE